MLLRIDFYGRHRPAFIRTSLGYVQCRSDALRGMDISTATEIGVAEGLIV